MQFEIKAGDANSYGGVFVFPPNCEKKKIYCFIFGYVYHIHPSGLFTGCSATRCSATRRRITLRMISLQKPELKFAIEGKNVYVHLYA